MKKHMKDRPGLLDDAQRIASAGRKGDKLIAHITPEEAMLLKARGGAGTVNPKTGLLEFYDGSDPMGSGSDYGSANDGLGGGYGGSDPMGSGSDYTPSAGWTAPDISGLGGPSVASDPGEQLAAALAQGYQPRDTMTRVGDWAGRQVNNAIYDVMQNPIASVINGVVGMIPGVGILNTIGGLTGVGTIGKGVTSAARNLTGHDDKAVANVQNQTGIAAGGSMPGMTDYPTQDGGSSSTPDAPRPPWMNYGQQPATTPGTSPQQVAQEAIRRSIVFRPQGYNSWQGNRFVMPGILG